MMSLPGLIGTSLILILASELVNSKGQEWTINVTRYITTKPGSDVTINCMFKYPQKLHTDNVILFWKTASEKSTCSKSDNDKKAFIYHANKTCVLEKYRGKTELIGDKDKGDCSLQIRDVTEDGQILQNIYVRIHVKGENYSYVKDYVSISFHGGTLTPVSPIPPVITTIETESDASESSKTIYFIIIFPIVGALLIILAGVGIFFFVRHKRSQGFTREESGYYANFSRTSSDQAKSEESNKKKDKELPEVKATEEPIYANVKAPTVQMDPSVDQTDSIYVNVNYSK